MRMIRSMKTTVDIPQEELADVMRHTGASTKREAIVTAICEFNRRRRLARVVEQFGTFEHFLSHAQLARLRDDG
jgi:Arc/MetJ family transcription regulator